MASKEKQVSKGRHENLCGICNHEDRKEIEREFLSWRSPESIVAEFGLGNRATVYRHAHAFGLLDKRRKNVRAALERMIERGDGVELTAAAVVSAITAYAKINSAGQFVERTEQIDLNRLFEQMTKEEIDTYAKNGTLPGWFRATVGSLPEEQEDEA
jgi:hypothetical protein